MLFSVDNLLDFFNLKKQCSAGISTSNVSYFIFLRAIFFIFFMDNVVVCRPGQEGRQRFNTTLLETCGAVQLVAGLVILVVIPLLLLQ